MIWRPTCHPRCWPLPACAVVLTSSLAAISAEFTERGPGHVYTEADWTTNFCDLEEPYVT